MDSELEDVVKYGSYICLSHEYGYLSSPGFLENRLYLTITDSLRSVFRILPTCTFTTQEYFLNQINSQDFSSKFEARKTNLEGEISTNIITSLSYKDQPLTFGSLIQLQHVYSSKFLALSNEKHESDIGNYKIVLQDFGSEMSIFYIQSAFKYQEEGSSLIRSGAKVRLGATLKDIEKIVLLNLDEMTKEVTGCFETNLAFNLLPYNLHSIGIHDICVGDFFQIIHSEENSCITGVKNLFDKNIMEARFSSNLQKSNGIWFIENLNTYEGGLIETDCLYTIKLLGSNKYLSAEAFDKGYRLVLGENTKFAVWSIVGNAGKERVESEKFYRIVNDQTKLTLSAEVDFEVTGQEHYFPTLSYDYTNISYFRLKKCPSYFSCGVVFLVTCQEFVTDFIESVKVLMDSRVEDLSLILKQFSMMSICLQQIELFCTNRLRKMISENVFTGEIDPEKQNTLKDLKFISSLTEILSFFSIQKAFTSIDKSIHKELKPEIDKLCIGIFNLIKVICMDNPENQEEAFANVQVYSKFISFDVGANEFLISLLKNNQKLLYKFSSYLSNERATIISSYIHSLRKNNIKNRSELLDLLTSLCTCNNEAINANQELIHEFLFRNSDNFSKITIPVSTENGFNIDLTLPHPELIGEQIIRLDRCCENMELYQDRILYFTKLVLLFAGMCSGKNYLNASSVGVWFSGRCLMYNLWNSNLTAALRASFGRLFTSIYIDCFAKLEEKRIETIKVLNVDYKPRKITQKFFRMESTKDVTDLFINATKNKNEYEIENTDEDSLHDLKDNILTYFENFNNEEYDELTYELLSISYKLTKFEVFGPTVYDKNDKKVIKGSKDPRFNLRDTGIYRLLNAIQNVIFSALDNVKYKTMTTIYHAVKENDAEKKSKLQMLYKIVENNKEDLKNEPIAVESQHLLSYLNSVNVFRENMPGYSDIEIECKLEILKILELVQDWRQDRLLNNILAWFKNLAVQNQNITSAGLDKLLPPIMNVDHYEKENHELLNADDNEILDLAWLGRDIIKKLLKLFCITNSYTMQNLILKIVMRCFSQRKRLMKSVYQLSLITVKEDSDIFSWVKISLALFSELCDQSEIWISYYKNPVNYSRNYKKFQRVLKILEHVRHAVYSNTVIEDGTISKKSTSESISKNRQNLIIKLGFHTKLINFIKDSIHNLEEVYDDPKSDQEHDARENMIQLFASCFKILSKLVYKNKPHQKLFYYNLQDFMRDLRMDLGQMDLIVEIFRDNYDLCVMVNEKILRQFIALIEAEGRQARFLELFPIVQVVNNEPIQDIQRLVFNVLAQNQNNKFLLYMDQNGRFTYESTGIHVNPNYKDQPVLYHCKILESICLTSIGTKNIYLIEAKCQKLFPISFIFEALNSAELKYSNTASMRMPLLKLFYFAYAESEKTCEELMMNHYFIEYVEKHSQNMDEPIEYLDIMVWIFSEYTNKYLKNDRFVYETFDDFDAISGFLSNLVSSTHVKKLSMKTLRTLDELKDFFHLDCDSFDKNSPETNPLTLRDQDQVKIQWETFKTFFIHTNLLKSKLKAEKQALLSIIIHIKDYLDGISFKSFLTKLVNFIRQALSKHPPVEVLLNCINFIVTILSKTINSNHEKITKEQVQNLLCELGLIKIILSMMCDKFINKKIFNRLVHLSIEMLDGGNSKVQEAYYAYFISSEQSEMFFKKLHIQLSSKGNLLGQERISEQNKTKLLVYKKQKDNCLKILRLIQLLCENHNLKLQNYLRFQEKSNNNYNIIEVTVSLFKKIINSKRYNSFLILSQCLDTLTETIQGPCENNQKELISLKFIEISVEFLNVDQYLMPNDDNLLSQIESNSEESQETDDSLLKGWMIVHLKYKLSITLLSLLELNKNNHIISHMARSFSLSTFHNNFTWLFKEYLLKYDSEEYKDKIFKNFKENEKFRYGMVDNEDSKKNHGEERYSMCIIELGFNLYHLMKYLDDYEKGLKNISVESKKIKKLPDFLLKHEMLMDVYNLVMEFYKSFKRVFKRIKKKTIRTSEEIKEKALNFFEMHSGKIEITLEDGRIIYIYFTLQPESLHLTEEIKADFHNAVDRSSEKSKLQYLQMAIQDLKLEIKNEQILEKFFRKYPLVSLISSNVRLYYNIGFLVTLWLNIMLILSYHGPYEGFDPQLCLETDENGHCLKSMQAKSTSALFRTFGIIHIICAMLVLAFHILKGAPKLYSNHLKTYYNEKDPRFYRFLGKFISLILALCITKTIYLFFYTIVSLAAISSGKYFLYCIHTIDIIYRYQSLRDVVKSIYISKKSLIITFIFIIVLVYYFALWGYARLIDYYGDRCPDLYTCMIITYDQGLKLGMGWVLGDWEYGTFNNERVFFDNLFNLAILIMMMNFIKGIIFDAFFVLKDETDKNDWDMKHRCFICGLEREDIEKITQKSFEYHVSREHNEWNYALYIMHIIEKTRTELSSVESYVRNSLDNNSILWYPQKRANIKQNTEENKETQDNNGLDNKSTERKNEDNLREQSIIN